ncbi:hypothetical protein [Hyphococcus sp.]|uniref:hypothetical protein n=1 Tax=Hyphococcus sp. TaxID=2038636 RepID=UPI003D0CFBC2
MSQESLIAGIVAALIASAGLWWFRLVLPAVKKQPKTTRFGVYAIVWLAYFILIMIMIGRSGGGTPG